MHGSFLISISVISIGKEKCLQFSDNHLFFFCNSDPYLNTDAGTMSPVEHGEVYVLDDGGEVHKITILPSSLEPLAIFPLLLFDKSP